MANAIRKPMCISNRVAARGFERKMSSGKNWFRSNGEIKHSKNTQITHPITRRSSVPSNLQSICRKRRGPVQKLSGDTIQERSRGRVLLESIVVRHNIPAVERTQLFRGWDYFVTVAIKALVQTVKRSF
jgi:hypothetical protein